MRARLASDIERWTPTRRPPSTSAPSSAIQISASIAASSSSAATSARGRPCSRAISSAARRSRRSPPAPCGACSGRGPAPAAAPTAAAPWRRRRRPPRSRSGRRALDAAEHALRSPGRATEQALAARWSRSEVALIARRLSPRPRSPARAPRPPISRKALGERGLGLVGLVEARADDALGQQLLGGEVPGLAVRVLVAAALLARAAARSAATPAPAPRRARARARCAAAERPPGGVGLRRQRQVDGRLRERVARLGQPDVLDRRRPRRSPPTARRGSALPMSSEARITIRRTMKRGSSPPSSITAR